MHLQVLSPSVNQSLFKFTVNDEGNIVYGLGAIKGVGEAAADEIIQEREKNGPFLSLFQFCERLDLRKVNRRVIETLIKSSACDEWGFERAVLYASLEKALQEGGRFQQNQQSGQQDLFGLLFDEKEQNDYAICEPWSTFKTLEGEKETLGYYLSGHPVLSYQKEFGVYTSSIVNLNPHTTKKAAVCGLVTSMRNILTKRGKKLVIISIEDGTGRMDLMIFSEQFEEELKDFAVGKIGIFEGELGVDDFNGGVRMTASALYTVQAFRTRFAKCLRIQLTSEDEQFLTDLQAMFQASSGGCVVQIHYTNAMASALLTLSESWRIAPSDQLIETLYALLGRTKVEMCY